MQDTSRDNAGVIAPPPLLYVVALVVSLLLHRKVPLPFSRRRMPMLSTLLVGAGLTTGFLAVSTMRRAQTSLNPSEPVKTLVIEGPFKVTRNPIYVSFTLIYIGIALLVNTLWPLLLLPVVQNVMRQGIIEREERYLERKFGQEYLAYKERVPRWI
ncbi:MAG: methyltransferase family protein [Ktedonobacteraceae bacterium]